MISEPLFWKCFAQNRWPPSAGQRVKGKEKGRKKKIFRNPSLQISGHATPVGRSTFPRENSVFVTITTLLWLSRLIRLCYLSRNCSKSRRLKRVLKTRSTLCSTIDRTMRIVDMTCRHLPSHSSHERFTCGQIDSCPTSGLIFYFFSDVLAKGFAIIKST